MGAGQVDTSSVTVQVGGDSAPPLLCALRFPL